MLHFRKVSRKARNAGLLALVLLALGTTRISPAFAPTVVTFTPTDDAQIRFDAPTSNFGTNLQLQVDADPLRDSLIKFNVTGTAGMQVASAKLRLFQVDSSDRGGEFRSSSTTWSESSVTWNNAPAANPQLLASLGSVATNVWYEVDITPIVTGDGPVSLRVSSPSPNGARYSSKEGANPPQLVVTVTTPDTVPPTQPQNLAAVAVSSERVDLSWTGSTDNYGVAGYDVVRNGTRIATVAGTITMYSDTSVVALTVYEYVVLAFDGAGHRSLASDSAFVTTPAPSPVVSLVFTVLQDAYVRMDMPTVNFGGASGLFVDASPLRDILLKFNLSGVGNGQVLSAKLRWLQTDASPRGGDFRTASSSWSEMTVNWNSAPAANSSIIASLGKVQAQVWYEVDLTAAVKGDGLLSFRVSSTNTDGATYAPRESGNPARLNVTVSRLSEPSLTLMASPSPSVVGQGVVFSGLLSNSTGHGLANRAVEVHSLLSTSWITIATAATNVNGSYTATRVFSSAKSFTLRAFFAGDGSYRSTLSPTTVHNVTGTNSASFSFGASGDHDAQTDTGRSLAALAGSGSSFYLALGDLSYGALSPESAWCNYVTSYVGSSFPFELVSGNHESGLEEPGQGLIDNFAACLPDRIGSISGTYGKEYYFDYPLNAPLARIIMISPGLNFSNGGFYSYRTGSPHNLWVSSAIDGARAVGIPWVIVGTHKVCINVGSHSCEIGRDLFNLLISKNVDLVLQAHDHSYQRSGQIAFSTGCTTIPISPSPANPACVADSGADGVYVRGAGSVFVIAGIFGSGLSQVNASDTEAAYFTRYFGYNSTGQGHGFVKYTVSSSGISGELVLASGGPFSDSWSILDPSAISDTEPPSQPQNLQARAVSPTRVDLSWTASTDNFGVSRYDIVRNGSLIASVGGGTTSYSDNTVSVPASYFYSVTAFDGAGNPSVPSSPAGLRIRFLSFVATADTYVQANQPSTNFGPSTQMRVDADPVRNMLMKFSISGVGLDYVVSAKLRMYTSTDPSATSDRGGDFHTTTSTDWNENTVTWSNAPAANAAVVGSIGAVAVNALYEVDLTLVVGGDGVLSLRITSTSTDGANYATRESSNPPQLVVVVATSL